MNIKENYQQYVSRYASEVAALKRKNTGFITGELLAFGGILAFLVCYFALDGETQNYLMGAALCLIAYLGIRRLDDKNKEKIEHLSALLKVYQNEIKAWEGDFSPFETGDSYQNPQHPYSFDLDVFGKSSLFNRICRTITSGGSEALARNLTWETPLSMEDIKRRRDLQKELAGEGDVVGASCETAYSATKGGINALTKALAKELAPSNIQVNAIACGAIDTEMNQWMDEDDLIALVDEIPSGRLGRAEEVADLAYHLGYKESYLTGQIIGLDGGWI